MSELRLQHSRLDNRYDLLECLGRGSYAEVYVARDSQVADADLHRHVVIKALNTYLQGGTDSELERTLLENFRNEAVALDRVRHPNIISRLGHGTAIDLAGTTFHYLVLEYLSGGDLSVLCRRHPLALDQTLFYVEQTCAGLAYAHSKGVIHRDIKPHNLLLTADRQTVKIADFGVAKINLAVGIESAITRVGTDVYAAPEHHPLAQTGPLVTRPLTRSNNLSPAADVYSLAKTVYTLLTGEAPRRFANRTITEFPSPISEEPWAPLVLDVLARATRINPHERTPTVGEFWNELSGARRYTGDARGYGGDTGATVVSAVAPATMHQFGNARADFNSGSLSNEARDSRGRIIVDLAQTPAAPPHSAIAGTHPLDAAPAGAPTPRNANNKFLARLKLWAVGLSILLIFACMLYATYLYVRRPATTRSVAAAADPGTLVGREFITTTDVRLRNAPRADSPQIGLAERNSRVRVIEVKESWYQVRILRHGRTPDANDPGSEQGWLNSRYLEQ